MQPLFQHFFLISIFFSIPVYLTAQLGLKLNAETGVYNEFSDDESRGPELLNKLLGNIEFKKSSGDNLYQVGAKLRPQFLKLDFHSFKYRLDGSFNHRSAELTWRTNLSYTNYDYFYSDTEYSYDIIQLISTIDLPLNNQLPLTLLFGYSNYKINYKNVIDSDIFFISGLYNKHLTDFSIISFGLFGQKFDMVSKLNSGTDLSSKGWKYGPQLKLQYLRNFIFNAEYKFLMHNSNNTKYPSYEHSINLLSGAIVNKYISIFLLAEFNFIRTIIKSAAAEINPIFYTPTQNENEIYLKASFKPKKNFSVYSKIGYFRENFYLEEFKLDGIILLLGLEIKG